MGNKRVSYFACRATDNATDRQPVVMPVCIRKESEKFDKELRIPFHLGSSIIIHRGIVHGLAPTVVYCFTVFILFIVCDGWKLYGAENQAILLRGALET